MIYWYWLAGASLCFLLAERLRPARPEQRTLRPQFANDVFYLVFNGHFYAVLSGGLTGAAALWTRDLVGPVLPLAQEGSVLGALPWGVQLAIYMLLVDFLQWCVHVLLHRVPALWQIHKVHHSIHHMDWAGSFRFHWLEIVIYRSILFVPVAMLGGDPGPIFAAAVIGTVWGHFNHSNLDLGIGPLAYIFNSPRMHLWHHDASSEGGIGKNYGITLSLWDWIFGTAYWPRDRAPERIGYPEDRDMPANIARQLLFPLTRKRL